MNRKQAIDESIIHWEEMIKFAESYKGRYIFLEDRMEIVINQTWFAEDCPLCKKYMKYHIEEEIYFESICSKWCPLLQINDCCPEITSTWKKVTLSKSTKEWIKNAKKMLKVLRSLK